jgi:hypothetical protein
VDDPVHVQVQVVVGAIAVFFRRDDDVWVLPHEPLVERRHTHGTQQQRLARRPSQTITLALFSALCVGVASRLVFKTAGSRVLVC